MSSSPASHPTPAAKATQATTASTPSTATTAAPASPLMCLPQWLRTPLIPIIGGLLFIVAFFWLSYSGGGPSGWHVGIRQVIDTGVYWGGGQLFLTGGDLYGTSIETVGTTLPFTYPPFAALCFVPLAVFSQFFAGLVFSALNLLWLWWIACMLTTRSSRTLTAWLWCGAIVADPVLNTFGYGQINLVLMLLVLADVTRGAGLPGPVAAVVNRIPRGVLIGIAAAIKLTPAIFGLYFLLRRDARGVAGMAAGAGAATALAWLLRPETSAEYFGQIITDANRIGDAGYALNVSARAVAVRATGGGSAEILLWSVIVAAAFIACVVAGWRVREDPIACVTAVALLGLVASPVSWAHHWVWLMAAFVVCARRAPWVSLWIAVAAIVLPIHSRLPQGDNVERTWNAFAQIGAAQYLFIAAAVWWVLMVNPTPQQRFSTPTAPQHAVP